MNHAFLINLRRVHRRKGLELFSRVVRDEPGERRLSAPWRAPEHDRGEPVGLDQRAQGCAGCQQVVLPGDVVETVRTEPGRQRPPFVQRPVRRRAEQIITHSETLSRRRRRDSTVFRVPVTRHTVVPPGVVLCAMEPSATKARPVTSCCTPALGKSLRGSGTARLEGTAVPGSASSVSGDRDPKRFRWRGVGRGGRVRRAGCRRSGWAPW